MNPLGGRAAVSAFVGKPGLISRRAQHPTQFDLSLAFAIDQGRRAGWKRRFAAWAVRLNRGYVEIERRNKLPLLVRRAGIRNRRSTRFYGRCALQVCASDAARSKLPRERLIRKLTSR